MSNQFENHISQATVSFVKSITQELSKHLSESLAASTGQDLSDIESIVEEALKAVFSKDLFVPKKKTTAENLCEAEIAAGVNKGKKCGKAASEQRESLWVCKRHLNVKTATKTSKKKGVINDTSSHVVKTKTKTSTKDLPKEDAIKDIVGDDNDAIVEQVKNINLLSNKNIVVGSYQVEEEVSEYIRNKAKKSSGEKDKKAKKPVEDEPEEDSKKDKKKAKKPVEDEPEEDSKKDKKKAKKPVDEEPIKDKKSNEEDPKKDKDVKKKKITSRRSKADSVPSIEQEQQ